MEDEQKPEFDGKFQAPNKQKTESVNSGVGGNILHGVTVFWRNWKKANGKGKEM